jgi:hypothetical protein
MLKQNWMTSIPLKKESSNKIIWGMASLPLSLEDVSLLYPLAESSCQTFFNLTFLTQSNLCNLCYVNSFFLQIDIFRSTYMSYMCVIWYVCKLWHVNCFLPAYGINQSGVNNSLLFQLCLRFPLLYFLLPFLHSWIEWCVKLQSPKRQQ